MTDYRTWLRMQELHEQSKLNAAQIARELGLAPRTVRTWLREPYRPRKTARRTSKLDPFKGCIMGWLQQHRYSAVQILDLLREEGIIKIIESRHLMPKKSLFLIEVRGREYLVGSGGDSLNLIASIGDENHSNSTFESILKDTESSKQA